MVIFIQGCNIHFFFCGFSRDVMVMVMVVDEARVDSLVEEPAVGRLSKEHVSDVGKHLQKIGKKVRCQSYRSVNSFPFRHPVRMLTASSRMARRASGVLLHVVRPPFPATITPPALNDIV